jgi:hypothetical protein
MYVPWSIEDALNKLEVLLKEEHPRMGEISNWTDGTIDRICDIMETAGTIAEGGVECKATQWRRMGTDYRKHTRESKY